jgi:hypothetical protein
MDAEARAKDDLYFRARASGLDTRPAQFIAEDDFWVRHPDLAGYAIKIMFTVVAQHRTKSQMRRYVIRNRRSYNVYRASIDAHARGVLRDKEGMRCPECSHIPPQPGEVMEEGWEDW